MTYKKTLLILLVLYFFTYLSTQAQSYFINFTASGTVSTLDSVFVENLTQGSSLTLQGNDTLHLIGSVHNSEKSHYNDVIRIYPNPILENSYLELFNETTSEVSIEIYDVVGKRLFYLNQKFEQGLHIFEISGFYTGHYHLVVTTDKWQKTKTFISLNNGNINPKIQLNSILPIENPEKKTSKTLKNTLQMPFIDGNQIRFTAYSAGFSEIHDDVPTTSKTIDFIFTSFICGSTFTDGRDGNVYPTVLIGNQCWMAKNLAYLPSVVSSNIGSTTTPYHYVYGYNGTDTNVAKATANYISYGVLYNWSAAMDGAPSSTANPSGVKGTCPVGWHLPSYAEWVTLENYLADNGYNYDGTIGGGGDKVAKAMADANNWTSSSMPGAVGSPDFPLYTNKSGFSALPGGGRDYSGLYFNKDIYGSWWSASESSTGFAWFRFMYYNSTNFYSIDDETDFAFSVRCIKD